MPQLYVLPQNVTGLPTTFDYHPFRFIDFKEQAHIRKQAAQRSAVQAQERQWRFYMDFGFMRASTLDYSRRDKAKDRVVFSYDGFSSYLLIVDEASRYVWVFLTASNHPPLTSSRRFSINTVTRMVGVFGQIKAANWLGARPSRICSGGIFTILLNQLALTAPPKMVQLKYNDKFGVHTRTLLYGSGLPAKFWSAALLHGLCTPYDKSCTPPKKRGMLYGTVMSSAKKEC